MSLFLAADGSGSLGFTLSIGLAVLFIGARRLLLFDFQV
jgi:hypothetical protein